MKFSTNIFFIKKMSFLSYFFNFFRSHEKNWFFRFYIALIILFNFLNWLLAYYINIKESSDLTILHYNVDFGITFADNAQKAYYFPLFALLLIIINFIFLVALREYSKFLFHFMNLTSLLVNLMIAISLVFIYFINFG
jgi:hypothetical protein